MQNRSKQNFKIGKFKIAEQSRVFVIAEAGVNHNQRLDLALKLIDMAADTGADAVKFQTFKAEQVVTEMGKMASYQKKNTGKKQSQHDMLKTLELPEEFYPRVIQRCKEKDIVFLSTPHGGVRSAVFLESLKIPAYKIGSGDLTNYLLLNKVAKTGKPIILSSGMATLAEVKDAISFIRSKGNNQIAILHATTNYPCPVNEVNLLAMKTMMESLDVPVGYSDHTQGVQAAIMVATLGVAVYEGHLTVDKNLPGPDHIASADPKEFKERVDGIRKAKVMLGNVSKAPTASEVSSMLTLVRRSLVAARDLKKGEILKEEDLEAKRPGDGTSPTEYEFFIGKRLKKDLRQDEQLNKNDLK